MSSDVGSTESPKSVVDRVLEALNGKDIDAFVACYGPDATIEDGYDNVRLRGSDAMRERYAAPRRRLPGRE